MSPALQLRTLGGLHVERDGTPVGGSAARRKPLAFLAYVALHGDAGVTRDSVLAVFWPESDEVNARNSLKQTVFGLRRDLGADVFTANVATLRVDRAHIAVDTLDFLEAIERDDTQAAVALYHGPFFDGVAMHRLDDFERWVEDQRQRFARACARALEVRAEKARQTGDHAAAVEAWRRRAVMDPLSGRGAAGLMRALRDAGDHTAALDHWRVHDLLVRTELGAAPDPTVAALAAELRSTLAHQGSAHATGAPNESRANGSNGTDALEPPPVAWVPPAPDGTLTSPGHTPTPAADATPHVVPVVARPARWRRPLSKRVHDALIGAAATVFVGATIAWRMDVRLPQSAPTIAMSPSLVAVMPFAVRGVSVDSARVGLGAADLVSVALHGAGRLRSVPPAALLPVVAPKARDGLSMEEAAEVAHQFGAMRFVLGEVVRDGDRVHLTASLHGARGALLAQASSDGSADRLGDAADHLVIALLGQQGNASVDRLARVAAASTHSLDALKAWLTGEAAYSDRRYAEAAVAFRRATAADPEFALAFYRLASAADLLGNSPTADSAAARAASLGGRLPEAERELLRAWSEARLGGVDAAERRYENLLDDAPDHLEGWFRLGELRFRANPTRGRSVTEARGAFEHVIAIDPDHTEALVYLARVASLENRMADADTLIRRARASSADGHALEMRAVRTFALGEGLLQVRALQALVRQPPGRAEASALDVAIYRDDVDGTRAFAVTLLQSEPSSEVRVLAYRLLALASAAHGRWHDADAMLDTATKLDPNVGHAGRALLVSQPFLRADRATLANAAAEVGAWTPPVGPVDQADMLAGLLAVRHHRLGLLAAALGDDAALGREITALRTMAAEPSMRATASALAASLTARAAQRARRLDDALRALDDARRLPERPWLVTTEPSDRYLRAELLHALGRDDEATGWYASMAQRASYELPWLAPSELRLGEIFERRGDAAAALAHYRRFLTLWQGCDAPLRAVTDDVARRVRRLEAGAR